MVSFSAAQPSSASSNSTSSTTNFTKNKARKEGLGGQDRDLKHATYALWKNPEDLTDKQAAKLAWVAKVNHYLYRAYLLKEQLRQVFALKGEDGKRLLDHWLARARRCRIPAFVHLAQRIAKHRISINASLERRLSNGLVESTNTKVRLLTRMAFGPWGRYGGIWLHLPAAAVCSPSPARHRRSASSASRRGDLQPMTGRLHVDRIEQHVLVVLARFDKRCDVVALGRWQPQSKRDHFGSSVILVIDRP